MRHHSTPSFLLIAATLACCVLSYSNVKMLCLVNKERAKRGLQALGMDPILTQTADAHSKDQARRHTMSHSGSNGSSPGQRVEQAGFKWRAVAENVAYGYQDETSCMKEWMQSPGHKANILGKYDMFGSGAAYSGSTPYYTQDFGTDSKGRRNVPKCDGSDSDTGGGGGGGGGGYNGGKGGKGGKGGDNGPDNGGGGGDYPDGKYGGGKYGGGGGGGGGDGGGDDSGSGGDDMDGGDSGGGGGGHRGGGHRGGMRHGGGHHGGMHRRGMRHGGGGGGRHRSSGGRHGGGHHRGGGGY